MSKSNIVTRVRYKKDVNFQRLVGGWCKYVSKDGANGKSLRDFSSVNDLYEKEQGIYDDNKESEECYICDKNGDVSKQEILKDLPKDKSGRMWTLVLSFPPDFALESGLKTKQNYYLMTKAIMPKFILDNDLDLTNTKWYASLHQDTDNPHLHINLFELEETRKKDTLEKTITYEMLINDYLEKIKDLDCKKYLDKEHNRDIDDILDFFDYDYSENKILERSNNWEYTCCEAQEEAEHVVFDLISKMFNQKGRTLMLPVTIQYIVDYGISSVVPDEDIEKAILWIILKLATIYNYYAVN